MTDAGVILPCRVYSRRSLGVDPPSVALGLDLAKHMTDGVLVAFEDNETDPPRSFELHRMRGAFRIIHTDGSFRGAFASAQAAIAMGWAVVDADAAVFPKSRAGANRSEPTP